MNKIKKWICRKFGHKFDFAEKMTLEIMQKVAINKNDFKGETILCKRCKIPCSYTINMVGLYENKDEFDLV